MPLSFRAMSNTSTAPQAGKGTPAPALTGASTAASSAPFAILDFPEPDVPPGGLVFTDPVEVIVAERVEEVRPALEAVERAAARGLHAVGFVAYEAAPAFDPALVTRPPGALPLAWFAVFRGAEPAADVVGGQGSANAGSAEGIVESASFTLSPWEPNIPRDRYDADIAAIREAIARGETYQVNHTLRLHATFEGDATSFYRRLRTAQGGGYGAYLDTGRHRIVSASPELFFSRRGTRVTTRPMKGTRPRGRWLEEDEAVARALAESVKDRAENVMIVDLLRNDLGRVARFGSVRVPRLFDVERYRTVWQMTSTIEGDVAAGTSLATLFTALFPCGSVTGAPKVATMRLIAALEEAPRGVYCGAIGWVRPGGDCVFNVAIRTVQIDAETGRAEYGVGGGITWDSTPAGEYAEALAKAAVLTHGVPEFELIETLRLEDGDYVRLDRHLARLAASARYFGWPDPSDTVRAALTEYAAGIARDGGATGVYRVRVLVGADGEVRVEGQLFTDGASGGLTDGPQSPSVVSTPGTEPRLPAGVTGVPRRAAADTHALPVAIASRPVSRRDPFRYHKTTRRELLDELRAERPDVFDVLLYNEEGEFTEFTRGNLVVALEGALWTPPRGCGLLAGALRDECLDQGEIHERVIRREELERADAVWFINSLRGWVPVRLAR